MNATMNADHARSQELRARLCDRSGLLGKVVLYHPKTQTVFRRYFFYATTNLFNGALKTQVQHFVERMLYGKTLHAVEY